MFYFIYLQFVYVFKNICLLPINDYCMCWIDKNATRTIIDFKFRLFVDSLLKTLTILVFAAVQGHQDFKTAVS